MNATATDSLRALAKRYPHATPRALREMAEDLGLAVAYDSSRRTWYIAEDARTVRTFNEHLADFDFTA